MITPLFQHPNGDLFIIPALCANDALAVRWDAVIAFTVVTGIELAEDPIFEAEPGALSVLHAKLLNESGNPLDIWIVGGPNFDARRNLQ